MGLFQWAVFSLLLSLGAGVLGFTNISQGAAAVVARGFFGVLLAISLVLLVLVVILGAGIAHS